MDNEKKWYEKVNIWVSIIGGILGTFVAICSLIMFPFQLKEKLKSQTGINEENTSVDDSKIISLPLDDDEKYVQLHTNVLTLKVREYPYADEAILTLIPFGEKYKLVDKVLNDKDEIWYKIVIDRMTEGYIPSAHAEMVK